jgi:hypothetical protein
VDLYSHLHWGLPGHHLGDDLGRNHLSLEIRHDLSEQEGQILRDLFPSAHPDRHERSLDRLLGLLELMQQRE